MNPIENIIQSFYDTAGEHKLCKLCMSATESWEDENNHGDDCPVKALESIEIRVTMGCLYRNNENSTKTLEDTREFRTMADATLWAVGWASQVESENKGHYSHYNPSLVKMEYVLTIDSDAVLTVNSKVREAVEIAKQARIANESIKQLNDRRKEYEIVRDELLALKDELKKEAYLRRLDNLKSKFPEFFETSLV
jgi:hypothetical protein